jgi:hypothetical protein
MDGCHAGGRAAISNHINVVDLSKRRLHCVVNHALEGKGGDWEQVWS